MYGDDKNRCGGTKLKAVRNLILAKRRNIHGALVKARQGFVNGKTTENILPHWPNLNPSIDGRRSVAVRSLPYDGVWAHRAAPRTSCLGPHWLRWAGVTGAHGSDATSDAPPRPSVSPPAVSTSSAYMASSAASPAFPGRFCRERLLASLLSPPATQLQTQTGESPPHQGYLGITNGSNGESVYRGVATQKATETEAEAAHSSQIGVGSVPLFL